MSNLLNKISGQLSGQKNTNGPQQPSSSGLLHKITDAVTGQKHTSNYHSQQSMNTPGNNGMPVQHPTASGYPTQQYGLAQPSGYGPYGKRPSIP